VPEIRGRLETLEIEQLKMELWNRKWNAIFKGISGNTEERVS
jgi:hypothetical protein